MCLTCKRKCSLLEDVFYITFGALGMGYWMFSAVHAVLVLTQ